MSGFYFQPFLLVLVLAAAFRLAPAPRQIIQVEHGADLQRALDQARPGDTILLRPSASYVGNFVLPRKNGTAVITLRTADAAGQPRPGLRVQPAHAPALAKIQSPNRQPALSTAPGASYWRLERLEFPATQDGAGEIIMLGDGSSAQRTLDQVPHHITVDRCYIHGDADRGQKRGIALNSGMTAITSSYISDIKVRGQDAQAIAGWNGPGPYTIENSYLEASGENFLLGGADPAIPNLVPEDIVFRRNHLAKPVAWREQKWLVKNLFELKNARRVLVEGNLMEYSWEHGQTGYAILLTPRNQDGGAPWSVVEDVTIRHNIVRHAGGGLQITGTDRPNPSRQTRRVKVTNNLFYDIDRRRWGGPGIFLLIGDGPAEIAIEHNTIDQSGNIMSVFGGTREAPERIEGFVFRDNLVRHNEYGVHGADRAVGSDSINTFFPGGVFLSNGIAGGEPRLYPGGNVFLPEAEFDREFLDTRNGDFRLRPDSRFRGKGSDGRDLGADIAAIAKALGLRQR